MFMSAVSIGPLGVIEGDPLIAGAETKLLRRAEKLVRARRRLEVRPARQSRRLSAHAHRYAHNRSGAPPEALAMLHDAGVQTIVVDSEARATEAA